jgi:hypothetical protein
MSTTPVPGPVVFLLLALCSRKSRRSDASEGAGVPLPEGLSANTKVNCRGPVFLNPSLPWLNRLSPASTLLRRDPTSAWASSRRRCLLRVYRSGAPQRVSAMDAARADPPRPPWVRTLDVPQPPLPLPLRPRLDFGLRVRRHAHPAGPACSGVHFRSVPRFASGFFPTRPRGANDCRLTTAAPACSCLRLAVATNPPREGLSPPIQCPCQAHLRHPIPGAFLILIVAQFSP